ncbi:hypothetical protein P154DRAFT_609598 [Amniculicola lignicola CBS 123094]|uniref:Uncharacterized protein n=1 Tax=Amniculicola lignicola CBS 123094 TaxID=1392246 RepID=A0A6A5W487_9PLEO|nr:hypothetical protein P154DRAFT_609598 [Amniculicola lignicola CBS 123094]
MNNPNDDYTKDKIFSEMIARGEAIEELIEQNDQLSELLSSARDYINDASKKHVATTTSLKAENERALQARDAKHKKALAAQQEKHKNAIAKKDAVIAKLQTALKSLELTLASEPKDLATAPAKRKLDQAQEDELEEVEMCGKHRPHNHEFCPGRHEGETSIDVRVRLQGKTSGEAVASKCNSKK